MALKIRNIKMILILILGVLVLSGCSFTQYKGEQIDIDYSNNHYQITFDTLDGELKKKLSNDRNTDGSIGYKASLTSGSINVYYSTLTSSKSLMFTITEGETEGNTGYYTNGESVTIYIEASNAVKGNVLIKL